MAFGGAAGQSKLEAQITKFSFSEMFMWDQTFADDWSMKRNRSLVCCLVKRGAGQPQILRDTGQSWNPGNDDLFWVKQRSDGWCVSKSRAANRVHRLNRPRGNAKHFWMHPHHRLQSFAWMLHNGDTHKSWKQFRFIFTQVTWKSCQIHQALTAREKALWLHRFPSQNRNWVCKIGQIQSKKFASNAKCGLSNWTLRTWKNWSSLEHFKV